MQVNDVSKKRKREKKKKKKKGICVNKVSKCEIKAEFFLTYKNRD